MCLPIWEKDSARAQYFADTKAFYFIDQRSGSIFTPWIDVRLAGALPGGLTLSFSRKEFPKSCVFVCF